MGALFAFACLLVASVALYFAMSRIKTGRSTDNSPEVWAAVVVSAVAMFFGFTNLDAASPQAEQPAIDRSVLMADLDVPDGPDGVLDCLAGDPPNDSNWEGWVCTSRLSPLTGMTVVNLQDGIGTDPDSDSVLEWKCDEVLKGAAIIAPSAIDSGENVAVSADLYACTEVEIAGPSSDSFLLTDGQTLVERIDVNDDGKADFFKIGDEASQPLPASGSPWWRDVLVAVLGALALIGAALVTAVLGSKGNDERKEDGV